MSRRDYPRIGSTRQPAAWRKNPNAAPMCVVAGCVNRAASIVEVQTNWFRGDDERGSACRDHKHDAAAVLAGIDAREAEAKAKREAKAIAKAAGATP